MAEADFNDNLIDEPIGTGGPDFGEPTSLATLALTATVRAGPTGSPSLHIADVDDYYGGAVRFELFDNVEVTAGVVTMECELWFDSVDFYYVAVREQGMSTASFLSLYFNSYGGISFADTNPGEQVGSYGAGRVVSLRLVFRVSAGTYDVWVDDTRLLVDRAHGVVGHGVGAMLIGIGNDPNLTGTVYLDNLMIRGEGVTLAEPAADSG